MMTSSGYSLADIAAATGTNGRSNDGMWGGEGGWLWIIVVFALLFGWGGNGFGGWGGNNGGGYVATAATQADIQRGFDNQAVISKLDGLSNGLCDGFYAVNTGILQSTNTLQNAIQQNTIADMQNTFGIQQAINADTVANMQNTNALQSQLSNCCCETRESIQGLNFNMAQNTCALQNTMNNNTRDIIDNQNAGTRAILDYLCQKETADLRAENQALKLAASQSNQNAVLQAAMDANKAEILRRTAPLPVPAYPASNLYGYYGNGCTTGTGCC